MTTPCVCYMRCSGRDQISGDTWKRQLVSIRKYAENNALEIVAEFRDEGVTGKMELENRQGLSACIHEVQEKHIGIVLVESSDRLARDSIVAEICIREFQKIGVRVVSAEGVDLTAGTDLNPTAKLIRQILAAIAEFDRCVTVNKLRGARQRKNQQTGRCEGQKPYGSLPGEPGGPSPYSRRPQRTLAPVLLMLTHTLADMLVPSLPQNSTSSFLLNNSTEKRACRTKMR